MNSQKSRRKSKTLEASRGGELISSSGPGTQSTSLEWNSLLSLENLLPTGRVNDRQCAHQGQGQYKDLLDLQGHRPPLWALSQEAMGGGCAPPASVGQESRCWDSLTGMLEIFPREGPEAPGWIWSTESGSWLWSRSWAQPFPEGCGQEQHKPPLAWWCDHSERWV